MCVCVNSLCSVSSVLAGASQVDADVQVSQGEQGQARTAFGQEPWFPDPLVPLGTNSHYPHHTPDASSPSVEVLSSWWPWAILGGDIPVNACSLDLFGPVGFRGLGLVFVIFSAERSCCPLIIPQVCHLIPQRRPFFSFPPKPE